MTRSETASNDIDKHGQNAARESVVACRRVIEHLRASVLPGGYRWLYSSGQGEAMNAEQVLAAEPEEIREWCAMLDGFVWIEAGWANKTVLYPPKNPLSYLAIIPSKKRGENRWFDWDRWVPDYATSLDAVWPLQQATMDEGCQAIYHYWLCRVISEDDTNMIHKYIIATALDRARAICLCRLPELAGLLEGEKEAGEG